MSKKTSKFVKRPRLKKKSPHDHSEDMEKDGDGLNYRQRRFVAEYAGSLNATDAATRAGYSKSTACTIGSKLLRNVHIQRAVEKAQAKRLKRIDISGDAILQEIARVGFVEMDPKDVKVSDKMSALTVLARHAGLLVERHEVDTRTSILSVNVSAADLEDARQLASSSSSRCGEMV